MCELPAEEAKMSMITIGKLIEKLRNEKKSISRKALAEGLCSEQMLYDIEKDRRESDPLIVDILLQRLGKSPDKLERVLQTEMYRMVRLRDLLEKAILKGKRKLAEDILNQYPTRTNVDKMYRSRMRACLLYRIDCDYKNAKQNLQDAIALTLPGFTYERIDKYLISTIEMENLLALERIGIESRSDRAKSEEKQHLEILMAYIDKNFTDEEEYAKICSKCIWLLAGIYFNQGDYLHAMALCAKGMEGLRRNAILYFMFPLLTLMTEAEKESGINPKKSKWMRYREILTYLWDKYAEKWYPVDWLFHNCSQHEYHLDYELVRCEREARGMTQIELSDGIYKNVESFSRFETGKISPKKKTFEKLMEKLRIEKGRYNSYAVTDSFETMERRRDLDRVIGRREYTQAEQICERLKKELDMTVKENRQIMESEELLIQNRLGKLPFEVSLERQKQLLRSIMDFDKKSLCHIPTRNEVLLINYYCAALKETGQHKEAERIYRCVLQKMRGSKVSVKYRYRSYSLLLNNYSAIVKTNQCIYGVLRNELLCGKISVLPFCLNNVLHTLEREGQYEQECDRWAGFI
ncbi:MAG: helix-turn-helix domain-containing protein, partial [Lachnospiraceae bacterium]|nr:helix-turn-helix domain-containing protein [Lachnospiraceae bacterium]